jgi:hypothetical protein
MSEANPQNPLGRTCIASREKEVLASIVEACRNYEHNCAADYIRTGDLCWQYVCFRVQDRVKRKDATAFLKQQLESKGLRTTDISAFIKSSWLHTLCPGVGAVQVSVLKALLPVCDHDQEAPCFKPGVCPTLMLRLLSDIQTQRLNAQKVRVRVAQMLGNNGKVERHAWESPSNYMDRIDESCFRQIFRHNRGLRGRVVAALAAVESEERASA